MTGPGRLRRADAWLLALGLAAYGACLALHLAQAWRGRLAWVPVYVAPARDAGGHPVVRAFWSSEIAAASELAPGDEIRAVDGASLRGAGRLDFLARVYQHASVSGGVPLEVRSGGATREIRLELLPVPLSWRASVLAVAFVALGALAFWRTRGFGPARLFFGFAFGTAGIGAALLGDLADRGGIDLVYRLCSYLPALGLLTAFLPDIESGARRLEPARPEPEADAVPLV